MHSIHTQHQHYNHNQPSPPAAAAAATAFRCRKQKSHSSSKPIRKIDENQQPNKDRFIDLAQAALEEADIEEERKGVIHEVMEALIAKTGAPLVAEVISEQLRSQDVIEKIAEHCEEEDQKRRFNNIDLIRTDSVDSLKEPDIEEIVDIALENRSLSPEPTISLVAEYLWRFFRVLILASLVGLVYHFLSV
jgi:type I site-specific restriction endonuclease